MGALVSGDVRVHGGIVTSGFFAAWLAPFPLAVGVFALALCALLAATYLTVETRDPALREDFRRRALAAAVAVAVVALLAFVLAGDGAPRVRAALATRRWSWPFHVADRRRRRHRDRGARDAALSPGARGRRRADGADPRRLGAGPVSLPRSSPT